MSAPVSFIECVSKMAYTRVLSCVMLALISSIIASIQLNHAIIDIQENYKRRRLNLSRLLSTTTSTFTRVKRLRCRRESKERRFWTRPGRTSAWWNNFADQVVIKRWLCVYERFRVDRLKRYVNDDRFRVYGDKNMRLLAFAFTIVFVWTGPYACRDDNPTKSGLYFCIIKKISITLCATPKTNGVKRDRDLF